MSSSSHTETFQYGCKCSKTFAGEPNKIKQLLRLHYKICKYPKSIDSAPIQINTSGSYPHSTQKVVGQLPTNIVQKTLMKSFVNSK